MMTLNDRELATVLAALRYWQNDLDDPSLTEGFTDHFASVSRLDTSEIDLLCERINSDTACEADDRGIDDDADATSDAPPHNPIPILVDALEQANTQLEQLASLHESDHEFAAAKRAVESALTQF